MPPLSQRGRSRRYFLWKNGSKHRNLAFFESGRDFLPWYAVSSVTVPAPGPVSHKIDSSETEGTLGTE